MIAEPAHQLASARHFSITASSLSSHYLVTGHWPLSEFSRHPPLATCHPPPATRPAQTSGLRPCTDPPPLATAIHRQPDCQRPNGARSRRAAHLCQYVTEIQHITEPGNFFGQINPFLLARRRPTVGRQGLPTFRHKGNVVGPNAPRSPALDGRAVKKSRENRSSASGMGHPLSVTRETQVDPRPPGRCSHALRSAPQAPRPTTPSAGDGQKPMPVHSSSLVYWGMDSSFANGNMQGDRSSSLDVRAG